MLRQVEAGALFLRGDSQSDQRVDDLQQDEGCNRREGPRGHYTVELDDDLLRATAVLHRRGRREELDGEDAGQDSAHRAPDPVHAERIEGVVVAELALERDEDIAGGSRQDTNRDG